MDTGLVSNDAAGIEKNISDLKVFQKVDFSYERHIACYLQKVSLRERRQPKIFRKCNQKFKRYLCLRLDFCNQVAKFVEDLVAQPKENLGSSKVESNTLMWIALDQPTLNFWFAK